jgi:hypothetical protein
MLRQGPHHGAQKSTSTGKPPLPTWRSKPAESSASGLPVKRLVAAPAGRRFAELVARHPVERGAMRAGHDQVAVGCVHGLQAIPVARNGR